MQRLFRICRKNPPTRRDFMSHEQRGWTLKAPLTDERKRAWNGVSVFTSLAAARRRSRGLGDYIAELEIPAAIRRHGAGSHVNLEGTSPEELLQCCVRIYRV